MYIVYSTGSCGRPLIFTVTIFIEPYIFLALHCCFCHLLSPDFLDIKTYKTTNQLTKSRQDKSLIDHGTLSHDLYSKGLLLLLNRSVLEPLTGSSCVTPEEVCAEGEPELGPGASGSHPKQFPMTKHTRISECSGRPFTQWHSPRECFMV